jgi:hypothetical protein
MSEVTAKAQAGLMSAEALPRLIEALADRYQVVGPVVKGADVRFDYIRSPEDVKLLYSHTVLSPKKFFHRPVELLFTARRDQKFDAKTTTTLEKPFAVIGIHPCDLAALRLLDRAFEEGPYKDPIYVERRTGTFHRSCQLHSAVRQRILRIYGNRPWSRRWLRPCHHRY